MSAIPCKQRFTSDVRQLFIWYGNQNKFRSGLGERNFLQAARRIRSTARVVFGMVTEINSANVMSLQRVSPEVQAYDEHHNAPTMPPATHMRNKQHEKHYCRLRVARATRLTTVMMIARMRQATIDMTTVGLWIAEHDDVLNAYDNGVAETWA